MAIILYGQLLKQELLKDQLSVPFFSQILFSNRNFSVNNPSFFSIVQVITLPVKGLNDELKEKNKWLFQWKMNRNPDSNKKLFFPKNLIKTNYPSLNLTNTIVNQSTAHDRYNFGYSPLFLKIT